MYREGIHRMVKADTLPVLSEGDVSSVALLFAD